LRLETYIWKEEIDVDGMGQTKANKDQVVFPPDRGLSCRCELQPEDVHQKDGRDGVRGRLTAKVRWEDFGHGSELINVDQPTVPAKPRPGQQTMQI
jgi:hypothetical protein